ncbi:uncharacterized protein ASCRUDRAFT_69958 [Ascoidea rubescens DSM 1968]|uniref:Uncharacterized protein n=1 Tax=Ascoidea rubescens DSM 1968 TaxID=1344418 RepID=A0A1D2VII8_9ASCO|nr:hypothetical protein ASCRUDRAFT_69958 [Ascoidea rubescens DSM 1968]ODV61462.1 hypothetical protein ASCRUDRAFT_69958 [Ascoidea rubescens DSM 1968]
MVQLKLGLWEEASENSNTNFNPKPALDGRIYYGTAISEANCINSDINNIWSTFLRYNGDNKDNKNSNKNSNENNDKNNINLENDNELYMHKIGFYENQDGIKNKFNHFDERLLTHPSKVDENRAKSLSQKQDANIESIQSLIRNNSTSFTKLIDNLIDHRNLRLRNRSLGMNKKLVFKVTMSLSYFEKFALIPRIFSAKYSFDFLVTESKGIDDDNAVFKKTVNYLLFEDEKVHPYQNLFDYLKREIIYEKYIVGNFSQILPKNFGVLRNTNRKFIQGIVMEKFV